MRYELTIDPGSAGGAWLGHVAGGRAHTLAAWSWRTCKVQKQSAWRVLAVGCSGIAESAVFSELHSVGTYIRDGAIQAGATTGWRLTVEGLFGRGHTLERLSWYAGLVAGPLLAGAVGAVERPLATNWRRELLNIGPRTPAETCDDMVCAWIDEVADVPLAVRNSHVCDAVALAMWRSKMDHG